MSARRPQASVLRTMTSRVPWSSSVFIGRWCAGFSLPIDYLMGEKV